MTTRYLVAALLAMFLGASWAGTPGSSHALAQEVHQRLQDVAVLRGEFEQSKWVVGFKKPLISKGSFLIARDKGVLWTTREPFPGQLRLTRGEIRATQNGAVAFQLDASKEPGVRAINSMMFALLGGDIAALSDAFVITGKTLGDRKTGRWQLHLLPQQPGLDKFLQSVDLSGDTFVRQINIQEANGDKTQIRFTAHGSMPPQLSSTEAASFD